MRSDGEAKSENGGARYTSNLIVAGVTWNCPVGVLNRLMEKHKACITSTRSNDFVYFQIPKPKSVEAYRMIEDDFKKNECIEKMWPNSDISPGAVPTD